MKLSNASFENLRLLWQVLNNNLLNSSRKNPYTGRFNGLISADFDLDITDYSMQYKKHVGASLKKTKILDDITLATKFLSKKIISSHHLSCISFPNNVYPNNSALSIYYYNKGDILDLNGLLIPGLNYAYTDIGILSISTLHGTDALDTRVMKELGTSYSNQLKDFKDKPYPFKLTPTSSNYLKEQSR